MQTVLPRSERSTPHNKTCIKTSAKKKQWWVMVIGDSPLCGMEWPVCRLDPLFREVCCLPGAWIRDVTIRLKSLVQPSDYRPFLLFHMGRNDVTSKSLRPIKKNAKKYRSTGSVFFSPPSNGGRLWKKQATPGYQYLASGLVPLPKLQVFKPWKSLQETRYSGAWWDPPVLMGKRIFECKQEGLIERGLN